MSSNSSKNSKLKVLFLDDEIDILNALKLQMSLFDDYECFFLSNPLDTDELIESHDIDVIVADIVMPEKNGINLFQEIKVTHPHIVRILLTGYGDYNTALRAINEAEVFGFITKPWDRDYLLEHLRMARLLIDHQFHKNIDDMTPFVVVAQWDIDDEGISKIVHTTGSNLISKEYAKRIFLTASALFGSKYRFQNNLFTLPLKESGIVVRGLLEAKSGVNYGIFLFTFPFDSEERRHLDQIIINIEDEIHDNPENIENIDLDPYLSSIQIQ